MEAATSFNTRQDANNAYEIADSTDWLNTPAAGLMPVEQALRCHVCKDFYNSPMLTSCNHTFCSLCIRRCLNVDGKCPLCRATDQESKLRGNWALREVVEAFVKARPALIEVARRPEESPAAFSRRSHSPKRKATDLESPDSSQTKRTRTSARLSKKARGAAESSPPQHSDNDDHDYRPDVNDDFEIHPEDGLVGCPICHARMKDWAVDKHLDTSCPGAPPAAAASKSGQHGRPDFTTSSNYSATRRQVPSQPPPERLPSINYSLLKDLQLRKKMTELGISTTGNRSLLEMRHREWVTIWNANCDSSRPKRRSELLRDLDVWERTLGGGRASGPQSLGGGGGGAAAATPLVKDKDFDGAAWGARHDDSFKQLIASARRTRARTGNADGGDGPKAGNGGSRVDGTIVGPVDKPSSQTPRPDGVVDLTIQSSPSLADLPRKTASDLAVQRSGDVHSPGKSSADHGASPRFFAEELAPPAAQLELERAFQEIG